MQTDEVSAVEIKLPGVRKCVVWIHGNRHLELKVLIIEPHCRGLGLGSIVLRGLKRVGLPIHVYPVALDGDQDAVDRFYARNGFKPLIGYRPWGWYQDGDWIWTPNTK